MADNWTSEMQAQFDQLKQDIHAQFDKQTVELTAVISSELDRRFGETEQRLTERIESRIGTAEAGFGAAEGRLGERFDAAERRLAERFDAAEGRLTVRFDDAEGRLAERFDAAEGRLAERFDAAEGRLTERLDATEARLASQFKTGFEALRDQIKLLAEAFGGTIDGLKRDSRVLDGKVSDKIQLHEKVLSEHSRDIADLKARP